MATSPCNWTNPSDFVNQVLQPDFNLTDTVARCPDVCDLVYGIGDPDMSGKGVMISYFIQLGLTCLFGPILPILHYIASNNTSPRFRWVKCTVNLLRECQSSVAEGNLFYALTILVASMVRWTQTPPILEAYFIHHLTMTQALIMLTMATSTDLDEYLNSQVGTGIGTTISYNISLWAQFGNLLLLPTSAFKGYYHISKTCHEVRGYLDATSPFGPDFDSRDLAKSFGIGVAIFVGFMLLLINLINLRIRAYIPDFLRRHWKELTFLILSLLVMFLAVFCVIDLQRIRALTQAPNANGSGDTWGYGQTTAVLLWAPVLRTAVKAMWSAWWGQEPLLPASRPNSQSRHTNLTTQSNEQVPQNSVFNLTPHTYSVTDSLSSIVTAVGDKQALAVEIGRHGESSKATTGSMSQNRTCEESGLRKTPEPVGSHEIPSNENSWSQPGSARTSSWDVQRPDLDQGLRRRESQAS